MSIPTEQIKALCFDYGNTLVQSCKINNHNISKTIPKLDVAGSIPVSRSNLTPVKSIS